MQIPFLLVVQLTALLFVDNSSTTEAGDDSISISGTASGSYIYGNVGDDSISIIGGAIAGSVYGGSGKDSIWLRDGASTAALIDGGVGNDFLTWVVCLEPVHCWVALVKTRSLLAVRQASG